MLSLSALLVVVTVAKADPPSEEYARQQFWLGVSDIKHCEAEMLMQGYDDAAWRKCNLSKLRDDTKARHLGQTYESGRLNLAV